MTGMRRTTIRKRAALAAATPLLLVRAHRLRRQRRTTPRPTTPTPSSAAPDLDSCRSARRAPDASSSDDLSEGDEVDKDEFTQNLKDAMSEAESAHMTMAMKGGSAAMTLDGDVDYTTDPPTMAAVMSAAGQGKIEFRLVDGFAYMNMGELTQNKFLKADIDDKNSGGWVTSPGCVSRWTRCRRSTPSPRVWRRSCTSARRRSAATTPRTTRRRSTHERSTTNSAGSPAEEARPTCQGYDLTYDLWLDDEDRMRQASIDMGKQLGSMEMTVSKWNEPVSIAAPKPKQITSLRGLTGHRRALRPTFATRTRPWCLGRSPPSSSVA